MDLRSRVLIFTTALFCTMTTSSLVEAAGFSAKTDLPQAMKAAKKWQRDAFLVGIGSDKVQANGVASEWIYNFYSPKIRKRCSVMDRNNVLTSSGTLHNDPIAKINNKPVGAFIDSTKAMKIAKQSGLKGNEHGMYLKADAGGSNWQVIGGYQKGDTTIYMYANTGKVYNRTIQGDIPHF